MSSAAAILEEPRQMNTVRHCKPFQLLVDYDQTYEQRVAAIGRKWRTDYLTPEYFPVAGEGRVLFEATHFFSYFEPESLAEAEEGLITLPKLPPDEAEALIMAHNAKDPWVPAGTEHWLVDVARLVQAKTTRISMVGLRARGYVGQEEYLLTAQMGDGKPALVIQQTSLDNLATARYLAVRNPRQL